MLAVVAGGSAVFSMTAAGARISDIPPPPSPRLDLVEMTSQGRINISPSSKYRYDLKLKAVVKGKASPTAVVKVMLSQYGSRGVSEPVPSPWIKLAPVKLKVKKRTASKTTYVGSVSWERLKAAGEQIPAGLSALLCINEATAVSGTTELPHSDLAAAHEQGSDCVSIKREGARSTDANALATAVLRKAKIEQSDSDGSFKLSYSAADLAVVQDRPARSAESFAFTALARGSRWRKLFNTTKPIVEVVADGAEDPVTVRLGAPKSLGKGRYQSSLTYLKDGKLDADVVNGKSLAVFSNLLPKLVRDSADCSIDPYAKDPGYIPNDADFIGSLQDAVVTAPKGKKHLQLESDQPLFFNWFVSKGDGCPAQFTKALDFNRLSARADWLEMFGNIEPNSVLVWRDKGSVQSFAFEQSRPKLDADTGKWVSRIKPLASTSSSSTKNARLSFIKRYGRTLDLNKAYLYMDSTNSVSYGGELWVLDNTAQIHYSVDDSYLELTFTFKPNGQSGWIGLGFAAFMFPADNIIVSLDNGTASAYDEYNPGIPTLPTFPNPLLDTDPVLKIEGESPYDNVDNVELVGSSFNNGVATVTVRRALQTFDIFDFQFEFQRMFHVVAAYQLTTPFSPYGQNAVHNAYFAGTWLFE